MVQLKHWLIATGGLDTVITAVVRLNAFNARGSSPHGSVHGFDLNAPATGPLWRLKP